MLQPVPAGTSGELYIGGDGLARGYLRRPDLTADRFIPDPCAAGQRLYRTGDGVRRTRGGALEYLGRVDHQVKLRGHRIELGEIEAQLLADPAVRAAVVVLRDDNLVAYVVAAAGPLDPGALQAQLRRVVPEYMVPPWIVELAQLPLSPAGKVDRKALPAPDRAQRTRAPVAPRDDLERQLLALWQEVLEAESIGVHDSFFDLGGHSLSATRLASRIREVLAVELPLRVVFEAPSVAELADALRGESFGQISDAEVDEMSDVLDLLENPE
jgi:acyl carrier protein